MTKHYICEECCENELETVSSICPKCRPKTKCGYFITFNIEERLREILSREDFLESMNTFLANESLEGTYEGILDGSIVKELREQFQLLRDDLIVLSYLCHTDGINIFKSSKFAIWPLTFVVNELPPDKRLDPENVIMGGLWFGTKKPNFNMFFKCMKNQVKKMKNGLQVDVPNKAKPVTVRGFVVGLMGDIPAVAQCSNMKQHNGEFGCHYCYAQGEQVNKRRVFPYKNRLLRIKEETIEFAILAQETEKAVYGIKRPSTLADIIWGGDYITRTAVDVMHNICEGHVKHILKLLLDKKFHNKPWSLRRYRKLIDKRMGALKPEELKDYRDDLRRSSVIGRPTSARPGSFTTRFQY